VPVCTGISSGNFTDSDFEWINIAINTFIIIIIMLYKEAFLNC